MKQRNLEIVQNGDQKYTLTVRINQTESAQELVEVPGEKANQIISSIDLNPEDIIIMQKFVDVN